MSISITLHSWPTSARLREIYCEQGFVGPLKLLSKDDCRRIIAHELDHPPEALDWWKGRAATDPFYAGLARGARFLQLLRPLLGEDIVLWGVDILRRDPNQVHPWHCDMESSAAEGGFASVWIGIENTSRDSSLNVISRSHRFGC